MESVYIPPKKRIEFGEIQIGEVARKHLMDVCDSNWVSAGSKVKLLEKKWGELFGYKYNIAVSSGTDAVLNACLALYDLGAKPGDEIIVPALSFIATSNAVRAAGFTPVFVDIKKETLNIDEDKIQAAITSKTRAILVVHTMGKPCDMFPIIYLAKNRNLSVIEDCCEAHGAIHKGQYVGKFGDTACFSFYIAHLVCCGEGGMISTFSPHTAETINSTKCHGRSGLYFNHPRFGLNSKMNDLEASIGLESIENFHRSFYKRLWVVEQIRRRLDKYRDKVWFSEQDEDDINCPHGFSITFKEKGKITKFTDYLDGCSVHWKRNFGCIPTQHKAFEYLGYTLGNFPEAEWVGDNGLHVGVHPYLFQKDVEYLMNILDQGLEKVL